MNDNATPTVTPAPPPPPPPQQPQQAAQPKAEVDIGGWLKTAWTLFVADWLKYSVSALIVLAVTMVTCGILFGPMMVGAYQCFLKKARGQDFGFGDLFDGVRAQFLPAFVLSLVYIVPSIVAGTIPCIGPLVGVALSILINTVLPFAFFKIADATETVEVGSLGDLVKGVWQVLQPNLLMFIVWALVCGVLGGVGVIACVIGVFASLAFSMLAFMVAYLRVFRGEIPVIKQA